MRQQLYFLFFFLYIFHFTLLAAVAAVAAVIVVLVLSVLFGSVPYRIVLENETMWRLLFALELEEKPRIPASHKMFV